MFKITVFSCLAPCLCKLSPKMCSSFLFVCGFINHLYELFIYNISCCQFIYISNSTKQKSILNILQIYVYFQIIHKHTNRCINSTFTINYVSWPGKFFLLLMKLTLEWNACSPCSYTSCSLNMNTKYTIYLKWFKKLNGSYNPKEEFN